MVDPSDPRAIADVLPKRNNIPLVGTKGVGGQIPGGAEPPHVLALRLGNVHRILPSSSGSAAHRSRRGEQQREVTMGESAGEGWCLRRWPFYAISTLIP